MKRDSDTCVKILKHSGLQTPTVYIRWIVTHPGQNDTQTKESFVLDFVSKNKSYKESLTKALIVDTLPSLSVLTCLPLQVVGIGWGTSRALAVLSRLNEGTRFTLKKI